VPVATAGAAVTQHDTVVGMRLSRATLIRRGDLGSRWSEVSPSPRRVAFLTCPRFSPPLQNVVQTGAAASPVYGQSASGPFVNQATYAYSSAGQEAIVWSTVVRPRLALCFADGLASYSGHGVRFTVVGQEPLPLPRLPATAAAYRVRGTATMPSQTIDVYLDAVVLGRGSAITAISLASFEQPVAWKLELRLARAVARRLPTG
jgi:hypothetical protein